MRIGAFLFGAVCLFGAAEAQAAAVCSNTPGANDRVVCQETGAADIDIDLTNPAIATSVANEHGVHARHTNTGTGKTDIEVAGGSISATGRGGYGVFTHQQGAGGVSIVLKGAVEIASANNGVYGRIANAANEATIAVDVRGGSISATDANEGGAGVWIEHSGSGGIDIDLTGATVSTKGADTAHGIVGEIWSSGSTAAISIDATEVAISTTGSNAHGVYASHAGAGEIDIGLKGVDISATGRNALGVYAVQSGTAEIDIELEGGSVSTTNHFGHAVYGYALGASGGVDIGLERVRVSTRGYSSYGVYGYNGTAGGAATAIDVTGGRIATAGAFSYGVVAANVHAASETAISIVGTGAAIATAGASAGGFYVRHDGMGRIGVDLTDIDISTTGANAWGVYGLINNSANGSPLSIAVAGGNIAAAGLGARGLLGDHRGLGSVSMTTGAAGTVEAPFAVGMEAYLTNDANAAGRLLLTHEGAIKAGDVGVLAHAARSSGHTFGDGAQTADDAGRTAPAIHVVSGGDIAVGAAATDAFIANRIAGDDGTLSAGENAVLAAIAANDSAALDRALDALPSAYDDDYRTEARALLDKRGHEASSASDLARLAAGRILGLSRAGVRALALSHTAIANYIRVGDRDPAILAIAEATRTDEQQATLAEQEKLSADERKALEAVLTEGADSELETALTALTGATYTTAWKNTVRRLAASYNAGDVQVDVTGGAIDAEGNGVEALYAVPHDRNGAIAVSVAEGARVTGGANGLYVRGAGAGEGDLRAQSVTVNGRVTGGTGAGVRMIDGGRLTVGRTGRIGAASGVGVLSDGAGDLHATVAGTVEGDIEARGGGALRLDVREGGAVTGTVRDPVSPLTVAGSIGRLLYSSGGAVTVTGTGRLTGVEVGGRTEALGSESGDLSLTVADKGMVTGDVQARGGGRLTIDLKQGGTIAGTVHDPVGPLTVVGSIGRLLYSSGGAVTVARTGALTGVEVDGRIEAIRSESGDLDVTVAGRVAGDLRAPRGGALKLSAPEGGVVTGTAHDPVGSLTVAGSIGRLLYTDDGAVTVGTTGRLTGVDGVALRSEAGNLDLTVAGMATGDIDARGDGDLTVSVSGTVDGDIFGRGAGEHTVTVARGGSITGTVDLGASAVTADGSVGRVLLRRGGETTVGATGRITGIDGVAVRSDSGDLGVTVAAMGLATGDIDARGDGDLTVRVSGTVDGDIFGRGAGAHEVTVARGGRVTGTVDLGGDGAVIVEGMAGRVRFERDGAVTVGPEGRIPGVDGVSIESRSGAPAVVIVASADESLSDAVKRVGGAIVALGGEPSVRFRREGETGSITLGGLEPGRTVPDGAYDVGVMRTASGALRVVRGLAPRTRVYEALPSVLLGMERLSSHAERVAAPRTSDGAWARVDASRGSWEAASSANAGTGYDHRGFSFQAGVDAVLGEETRAGLSVHWRRATAKVSRNGGEIEARGAGVGLSATWSPGPFFVDGQAAATLYDVDLKSSLRGRLKDDVGAQGLSAALEAGRTVPVADGVTVTPRARAAYSSLSLSDFYDPVGARVSLDRGRSLSGRVGALAERVFGESRIFGSVDIEREFSAETRMSVAGTSLETAGEETRWMVGVGGEHGWEEGRFTLRGALDYAVSGDGARDYGAQASLSVRF